MTLKKEYTVVDRVILLSKVILSLKILKLHINRSKELVREIGINLFEMRDHVDDQINEINRRILEFGSQIKLFLHPLFNGQDFGYNGIDCWGLTVEDMQKGYVILEEMGFPFNKHVLFLTDYKDKKFNIKQGSILPFSEIVSILGQQKDIYGNLPKVNTYLKKLSDINPVKNLRMS